MTPSEKPERSASHPQQDAEQTSVITQTVDDSAEKTSAQQNDEGSGASTSQDEEDSSQQKGEGGGESSSLDGAESPPPWQRASAKSAEESHAGSGADSSSPTAPTAVGTEVPLLDAEDTQTIPKPFTDGGFPSSEPQPQSQRGPESGEGGRSGRATVSFASSSTSRGTGGTSARRPSRGPRRASLQVKRVDPWSVLKLALVLSVALFFVWMIAVAVLYGVLDGMGVWDQLNGTFTELTQSDDSATEPLISAGRVFGVASIVGAINIVLITALATVASFIYNVAADFAGGVEVTLSERE